MQSLQWNPGEKPPYTFCEPQWVTGPSPWCIRKTTAVGPRFGGGIDTPSLCGRVPAHKGWDLEVRLSEHHLSHACQKCAEKYRDLLRTEVFYSKAYDLLVDLAAASREQKAGFLLYFMEAHPVSEWHFQGKLGFGGKLVRGDRGHEVTYYPEDRTNKRDALVAQIHDHLANLTAEFRPTAP
jgi:hypothetical protein